MFTPTVAKPSACAISVEGCGLSGSAAVVAGVLDDGRERAVGQRPPSGARTIAARSVPSRASMYWRPSPSVCAA